MCQNDVALFLFTLFNLSSSSDEPLKWHFVDQFVSESGVGCIFNCSFMFSSQFQTLYLINRPLIDFL